jgi:hypothetical protein
MRWLASTRPSIALVAQAGALTFDPWGSLLQGLIDELAGCITALSSLEASPILSTGAQVVAVHREDIESAELDLMMAFLPPRCGSGQTVRT